MLIFKWSTDVKEHNLPYYLAMSGMKREIHTFSVNISAKVKRK